MGAIKTFLLLCQRLFAQNVKGATDILMNMSRIERWTMVVSFYLILFIFVGLIWLLK